MHSKPHITIDDFAKIDIRVGLVVNATPVPNSKKLILLTVDLGPDYGVQTILTGLLAYYPDPKIFINHKYLFLANLIPRTMAGVESRGMFLAIEHEIQPIPLQVNPDTPLGALVK